MSNLRVKLWNVNPQSEVSLIGQDIHLYLSRYKALKQFSADEEGDIFREKLVVLQNWQMKRLQYTHRQLLAQQHYRPATAFVINELYSGVDLTQVALQIERALPIALKVFSHSLLETAAIALELNALTGELDQALADTLFDGMQVRPGELNSDYYCQAYRLTHQYALRRRQLDLGVKLAEGVDRYMKKKWLYNAFKLARKPAYAAQLNHLYEFLAKVFTVLQPMTSAGDFLRFIAETEASLAAEIADGNNPFLLPWEIVRGQFSMAETMAATVTERVAS